MLTSEGIPLRSAGKSPASVGLAGLKARLPGSRLRRQPRPRPPTVVSSESRKHGTIDPGRPAALAVNALSGGREPKLDPQREVNRRKTPHPG